MLISYVIPAFNSSGILSRALASIFRYPFPSGLEVEVIVVNDGSADRLELVKVISGYNDVRLVEHQVNRGMCAARNTGIAASSGEILVILDSDDELVPEWPSIFTKVLQEWPIEAQICFAACRNQDGITTVQEPSYRGYLTICDLLNERHSGEYIPLFRGDYVRANPYVDLGMQKSCGMISYINFALDSPFWVTNKILRIYHEKRVGSVTYDWTSSKSALDTVKCYRALLKHYSSLYQCEAPKIYRTKLLRLAVYLKLSGLPGAWQEWWKGASFLTIRETAGSALILSVNKTLARLIIILLKRVGLIRRYG